MEFSFDGKQSIFQPVNETINKEIGLCSLGHRESGNQHC